MKNTGSKIAKNVKSIIAGLAIGGILFTGCAKTEPVNASAAPESKTIEDSTTRYEYNGISVVMDLYEKDIDYIYFENQFYTPDGSEVVKCSAYEEVPIQERTIYSIDENGNKKSHIEYSAPAGYQLHGDKAYKTIEVIMLASDFEEQGLEDSKNYSINTVKYCESKSYDTLAERTFDEREMKEISDAVERAKQNREEYNNMIENSSKLK